MAVAVNTLRGFVAVLAVVLLFVAGRCWAEPFAPKVSLKEHLKPGTLAYLAARQLKSVKVPDRKDVGLPPYPGARVRMVFKQGQMRIGDSIECLPMIRLLSTDMPDRVVEFYKKRLKGYRYVRYWTSHLFYRGLKKDYIEVISDCTTQHIFIDRLNTRDPLMPEAKTVIEIYYTPLTELR